MIEKPYLLVIGLPCYVDGEGRRFVSELWQKDLLRHLTQIRHLTLASPICHTFPDTKVLEVDTSSYEGSLSYVDLPDCESMVETLARLPRISSQLWKAIGRAEIVQGHIAGWWIALGWIAIPMARIRGKFSLTNVESAGWRLGFSRPWRFKRLAQAILFESLGRVIVNLSDMATFTHAGYRDSLLLPIRKHRGHVVPASWIDRENILSRERAKSIWDEKLRDGARPLRVVLAANLVPSKGVVVLLDALKELERRGVPVAVEIYGTGSCYEACVEASGSFTGCVKLAIGGQLAYGEPFFEMLQTHDLMVVPSLSDEQPRVVFDSFARALPVIASDTPGLVECVTDGLSGKIVPMGDVTALANAIEWAASNREQLRDFGLHALDAASSLTHDDMHARRARLIETAMNHSAEIEPEMCEK